jgi:lipoprotein-releasing system permease protein
MRLPLQLAKRYLLGKKSTNAINLITGISIFGLTIGTAALIIILSVFNGFEGLLSGLFNAFNPDLEISPKAGKTLPINPDFTAALDTLPGVEAYAICIEDLAMYQYEDIQEIGILKGVDKHYKAVTSLDSSLLYGIFSMENDGVQQGVIGSGLRNKLGMSIYQSFAPLTIFTVLKQAKSGREFNRQDVYPAGVFSVQSDKDYQYMLVDYALASQLFEKPNAFSTIELKLSPDADISSIQQYISTNYADYAVKTRYEQDAAFLKILQIEKWIAFLIVCITMILIAFNLIGSLWMIVLEKQKDIAVLRAMGYTEQSVFWTILVTGVLMTLIGLVLGIGIAILVYGLQKTVGIVTIPEGFMISNYPIEMRLTDLLIVSLTVLGIGSLGSLLPAMRAQRIEANVRAE